MTPFDIRALFAVGALVLLTACGGSAAPEHRSFTSTAAVMEHGPAPVADCEAEGCNQPRIVDGLAEQYRFNAVQQPQQEQAFAAEPVAVVTPMADAFQVATATEAAPAAGQIQ